MPLVDPVVEPANLGVDPIPDCTDDVADKVADRGRHGDQREGAPKNERAHLIRWRDEVEPEDEIDHRLCPPE